jgi:hypothetical protein
MLVFRAEMNLVLEPLQPRGTCFRHVENFHRTGYAFGIADFLYLARATDTPLPLSRVFVEGGLEYVTFLKAHSRSLGYRRIHPG